MRSPARSVVGWSIDTQQNTLLVTSALTMATRERNPSSDLVTLPAGLPINTSTIKVLRGPVESSQFTSWAFSIKVRDAGLAPSMGAVGTPHDNAMVESFWGRMQVELLNRKRWQTRIELAAAIKHLRRELPQPQAPLTCSPQPNTRTATNQRSPPDPSIPSPQNRGQVKLSAKAGPLYLGTCATVTV